MTDMSPAEAYEKFLVPFAFEPWARRVIDAANLQPGQRVLDIGCGTGVAARLAAATVKSHGSVVGADIDEGMLSVARRTLAGNGAAKVDWRHADAMSLPCADLQPADYDARCSGERGIDDRKDRAG